MQGAIGKTESNEPTVGWLYKEGGRKTGLSLGGWKRRWFVLDAARDGGQLRYYESPSSSPSLYLPCTCPLPSLYLTCTFPVPSLYFPCT